MRIHLISNLFAPDELAGAALYTDLALYLRAQGHDVRVTCCFPYYPAWKLREQDVGCLERDEVYSGIPVRRISMRVPEKPTGKGRMLADASFFLNLLRRGRYDGWSPEVVITAIPMLSQALAQRFLYWGRRIPRLIVVQDFVVEAALELEILKFPGIAPILHGLQRWALRSASTLTTIGPPMLAKLRSVVGTDRRTLLIPNWIHGSLEREIARQKGIATVRQTNQLFYAGNLGVKQGLPDFLPVFGRARDRFFRPGSTRLSSDPGGPLTAGSKAECPTTDSGAWTLAIHGGGAERDRLQEVVAETPGCTLGHVLEEPDYIGRLLTATACLVTQRAGVGANFLPSKLLPALATGTPVLAVCDRKSPLGEEVLDGGFGEVIAPGDVDALFSTLERWTREPGRLEQHGQNALKRGCRYSRDTVLSCYEMELHRLLGKASDSLTPKAKTTDSAAFHV